MKRIEYRIVYAEGEEEVVTVPAININSGFDKALKIAKLPLGDGTRREIARVEFWKVQ